MVTVQPSTCFVWPWGTGHMAISKEHLLWSERNCLWHPSCLLKTHSKIPFCTPGREHGGIFILESWGYTDITSRLPLVHCECGILLWLIQETSRAFYICSWTTQGCPRTPGAPFNCLPWEAFSLTKVTWGCSGPRDNSLLWKMKDNFLTSVLFVFQGVIHFNQIIIFASHI